MQLKELLRQLKAGEQISFAKEDDAVGVRITLVSMPSESFADLVSKERTITTQQITGSGADLVRDTIEGMLKEIRK